MIMKYDVRRQTCVINYVISKPGGNDTAIVYGSDYTQEQKKCINDAIMKKNPNVEQVGFIDFKKKPELQMAGGEFCGNATRSAAILYLDGKAGSIKIIVNGKDVIDAGVYDNKNAWCEIPLYQGTDTITSNDDGIYFVKMNGMVCVVIQENIAEPYLQQKSKLKEAGMNIIKKYNLEDNEAVGVMFCECIGGIVKINPVVWVKSIDTLFYETACGSGTTAVAMVKSFKEKKSLVVDIIQPSEMIITASITMENGRINKAIISGPVENDEKNKQIIVEFMEKDLPSNT